MKHKEEIHIGSTGFSQFGTPDYYEKQKFEGKWLINYFIENFTLHPRLSLQWKRQPYEYDSYWDLIVYYYENDNISEEEMDAIWASINQLEEFDIESLEQQIQEAWNEENCKIVEFKKAV